MATEKETITELTDAEIQAALSIGGAENVITTEDGKLSPLTREKEPVIEFKKPEPIPDNETDEAKAIRLEKEKKDAEVAAEIAAKLKVSEIEDNTTEIKKENVTPLYSAINKLVESGEFFLFDDAEKPELKDYTEKELVELYRANITEIKKEAVIKPQEDLRKEFFDALPEQFQIAAAYFANGGTDVKGILKHLAQNEEVLSLDVTKEEGQEQVVRKYLSTIEDLTPEEVEDEITTLKDLPGALEKKAAKVKPKLEAKQQQIIDKELKDQELRRKQQAEQALKYKETIYNVISTKELDGIKLTKDMQEKLYKGLTEANYSSVSGRNTNLFGHLIEKYNYVEPNPTLIAEATWLLSDSKGYKEAVRASAKKEIAEETLRQLKTTGQKKATTSTDLEVVHKTQLQKKLPNKVNFFERPKI